MEDGIELWKLLTFIGGVWFASYILRILLIELPGRIR